MGFKYLNKNIESIYDLDLEILKLLFDDII
jgi:hypothetical protein